MMVREEVGCTVRWWVKGSLTVPGFSDACLCKSGSQAPCSTSPILSGYPSSLLMVRVIVFPCCPAAVMGFRIGFNGVWSLLGDLHPVGTKDPLSSVISHMARTEAERLPGSACLAHGSHSFCIHLLSSSWVPQALGQWL